MHAHAIGGEFLFSLVHKKCAKESSLSRQESDLKNKFLNYKKSEKRAFEISFRVKKLQFFLQKMLVCAREGEFSCSYNQKMRKEEFFRLVRVKFEK